MHACIDEEGIKKNTHKFKKKCIKNPNKTYTYNKSRMRIMKWETRNFCRISFLFYCCGYCLFPSL